MHNISAPLTPQTDRPIDPATCAVIRAAQEATADMGLDMCLIGATARLILLEHVYGLPGGRGTKDVDFAFAVENWAQFEAIKAQLISTQRFQEVKDIAHRLQFKANTQDYSKVVDLVPFGGIEGNNKLIAWPPCWPKRPRSRRWPLPKEEGVSIEIDADPFYCIIRSRSFSQPISQLS